MPLSFRLRMRFFGRFGIAQLALGSPASLCAQFPPVLAELRRLSPAAPPSLKIPAKQRTP